jgi:O-antigen/teichoic acid export membrane protein
LIVGGFITLNDDFIRLWVGPNLFAGQTINVIISVTIFFAVITNSLSNICFALGNIKNNNVVSFIYAISFILFVTIGVKYLGLLGVVLAPLFSMLILPVWYYPRSFGKLLHLSKRDWKMLGREIFNSAIVPIPLVLIFININTDDWYKFSLLICTFTLCYMSGLWLLSPITREEGVNLLQYLHSIFTKRTS